MTEQLKMYKEQIEDTLSFLGPLGELENLDKIESIDKVIAMEKALNQIINGTKIHKENYENMLMNHFKCPAQVTNKGLSLNGEPGPSSLLGAPSPLRLPEFTLSPHIDSAFGKNNSYFSNFDVTTGGVQLNGTGCLSSAWFCMGQNPQSLLLENSFSLHQGDLTSISSQGCTSSDETEAIMSNKKQTPPLQYMRNGASSSQQTMIEHNHLPKTSTLGEGLLNANIFADNLLIHNPFVFDQSFFGCDFKTPDFDAWASADQPDIKPSIYLQQNQLKNRDII